MKKDLLSQNNKLYIITNGFKTAGYQDVISTLDPNLNKKAITKIIDGREDKAIVNVLKKEEICERDVICITRGGGNLLDPSFRAYHNFDSAQYLSKLNTDGVIIVTGIGL